MELTQTSNIYNVTNNTVEMDNMNTNNNIDKSREAQESKNSTASILSEDASLSDSLSFNIEMLSNVSTLKKGLALQNNILNDIEITIQKGRLSPQGVDSVQPSVAELMDAYNRIGKHTNFDIGEEPKSTMFFDGVYGATPLKPKEIFEEIEKQRGIVSKTEDYFNELSASIQKDSMNIIKAEKDVSQASSPFKEYDYSNAANDIEK
ncbi:MAG: hypothetical protein U9Q04_03485, partial [Campylobacterota bacterium]|nr:hypothetical protein [Campylobacterota bacterium]